MIRVCVDIDNVLNDLTKKTLILYNSHTGKNIQMADITTYNFYDCLPEDDASAMIALFKEKELWDSLEPLPGAQIGMESIIKQGHEVYLATATDPINFQWKCDFINKHFPFIPTDNIIRIMNKSLLKTDVLIDDHLENLTSILAERVCLNYAWNQSTSKDYSYDIWRAFKWSEIPHIINDIERRMKEWEKM